MTSNATELSDVRRSGRLHAAQRSVWIMCCLLTLFVVIRIGNRYLSNRRLMKLAESCNSERVDLSLGWKDPGYQRTRAVTLNYPLST